MRQCLIAIAFLCIGLSLSGQEMEFSNTVMISPGDSEEMIVEKAAHVIPTPEQLAALENEFIAFIHFGPNTFTGMEWGTGLEDPGIFDLKTLDTDQWCEAISAAGMKMVILTVKHHDGFVLWQSRYTEHGIMSTGFMDGHGDILGSLSESCRKYGLKLGVYLSPADLFQIENERGLYGNMSKSTMRTIPRPVEGRPFKNRTTFRFMLDDYNEYFMNQLFEILTEYGDIHEVWFDGAHPKHKGGQRYNYTAWKQLIRTLAPEAVVFGKEDIRWCGNEAGRTRDTEWNVVPYQENPDTLSFFPDMTDTDLGSREILYNARYLHYQPAETNTSIREGWFYRDDDRQKVRSADDVFDIYERSVGGNSIFLLNIPPDRDGRLPDTDVAVLKEVGRRIRETYSENLLESAEGPAEVLDNDPATFFSVSAGGYLELKMPAPLTFNRLLLQESVALRGERVEKHVVEVWQDGNWKEIAKSTNIGYKRILRFPEVTADRIRVRFPEVRADAAVSRISAHYYHSRPPRLAVKRNLDGMVEIEPASSGFSWKPNGENSSGNLNSGYAIHYTLDGSEPSASSPFYSVPFYVDNKEVKAVSVLNGEAGSVTTERFGYVKKGWTVHTPVSAADGHHASFAFDGNPATYWMSEADAACHSISVDMGKVLSVKGFSYTPQTENSDGMMEQGTVWISRDGKRWKKTSDFVFGNLINDPTRRYHYFTSEIKTRYLKWEMTKSAGNSAFAAAAEFDVF